MLLIQYPKCTTCKKAGTWLKEKGIACESRDIKLDNPTAEELKAWIAKSGLPVRKFFNTSGQRYREMNLKDRLDAMTEEEMIGLSNRPWRNGDCYTQERKKCSDFKSGKI